MCVGIVYQNKKIHLILSTSLLVLEIQFLKIILLWFFIGIIYLISQFTAQELDCICNWNIFANIFFIANSYHLWSMWNIITHKSKLGMHAVTVIWIVFEFWYISLAYSGLSAQGLSYIVCLLWITWNFNFKISSDCIHLSCG